MNDQELIKQTLALGNDEIDAFVVKCILLEMDIDKINSIAKSYCISAKADFNAIRDKISNRYSYIYNEYTSNNDFKWNAIDNYGSKNTRFDKHLERVRAEKSRISLWTWIGGAISFAALTAYLYFNIHYDSDLATLNPNKGSIITGKSYYIILYLLVGPGAIVGNLAARVFNWVERSNASRKKTNHISARAICKSNVNNAVHIKENYAVIRVSQKIIAISFLLLLSTTLHLYIFSWGWEDSYCLTNESGYSSFTSNHPLRIEIFKRVRDRTQVATCAANCLKSYDGYVSGNVVDNDALCLFFSYSVFTESFGPYYNSPLVDGFNGARDERNDLIGALIPACLVFVSLFVFFSGRRGR